MGYAGYCLLLEFVVFARDWFVWACLLWCYVCCRLRLFLIGAYLLFMFWCCGGCSVLILWFVYLCVGVVWRLFAYC